MTSPLETQLCGTPGASDWCDQARHDNQARQRLINPKTTTANHNIGSVLPPISLAIQAVKAAQANVRNSKIDAPMI